MHILSTGLFSVLNGKCYTDCMDIDSIWAVKQNLALWRKQAIFELWLLLIAYYIGTNTPLLMLSKQNYTILFSP